MSGDELVDETIAHFVDAERILRIHGTHLRLENGLQQHVAEFFTHVVAIVRFHSVDVFVGFFQQWFKQACIGLLAVPRASAWFVQNAYDLLDAVQRARSISYRVKFRTVLEFFGQLVIVMRSFSHTADSSRMCRPCSCGLGIRKRLVSRDKQTNRIRTITAQSSLLVAEKQIFTNLPVLGSHPCLTRIFGISPSEYDGNTTPLYMIKRVCINSRKKRKGNERIARFQRQ